VRLDAYHADHQHQGGGDRPSVAARTHS
jgi:hypothetical protein